MDLGTGKLLGENDPFLRNEDRAWLPALGSVKTKPSHLSRVRDSLEAQ